jgi:ribonuclease HI
MKKFRKIELFTDGASWGNPGRAGVGVIVYDENKKIIKKFGKFIGETTNNVAEYLGLVYGLEEGLILGAQEVVINLDSELLANQLEGLYKVKDADLKVLFAQASRLMQGFKKIEIRHIGREKNKEADRLAAQAIKEATNPVRNRISNGVKKKVSVTKNARKGALLRSLEQKELF